MRVYFIRHGQSENNVLEGREDYRQKRTEDPSITPTGRRQVEALSDWIASDDGPRLEVVYSSLHRRALQTGEAVASAAGLEHQGLLEIHEGGGIVRWDDELDMYVGAPGMSHDELRNEFPRLLIPQNAHPAGWWRKRELEGRDKLPTRADQALKMLTSRHSDEHVALVSHYLFYVYFMRSALGLSTESQVWFALHNCATSCLDINERGVKVNYLNREDYIPAALRAATPLPV